MQRQTVPLKAKIRHLKKEERLRKKEDKKYLGFIPAKYITPGVIFAGLLALGGVAGFIS